MSIPATAPYLRATVTGERRHADVVLPTQEPVSSLLPQLLDLLDQPHHVGRIYLTTSLGHVLDSSSSLAGAGLVDGVRLHLVTAQHLPPAPLVHDLVDVVESSEVPGRWADRNRIVTFAVLGGALVGTAIGISFDQITGLNPVAGSAIAAMLLTVSGLAASFQARAQAWVTAALGIATAGVVFLEAEPSQTQSALSLIGLLAAALVAVGWCSGQLAASGVSVLVVMAFTGLGLLSWELTDDVVRTAGVVSIAAVFFVGILPRCALGVSGVFGLDSRLAEGRQVTTVSAEDAVAKAHWTLTGGTAVTAGIFGVASFLLGYDGDFQLWPTCLAFVMSVAFGLRGRHFPLALHRGLLWAAAWAGPVGLMTSAVSRWPSVGSWLLIAFAFLGVVIMAWGLIRPTPLQQARLRRRANQLETAVIVLSLPTLLGVFTVYQDLLGTFR
ncbi:MAG: type VII secretion integral membrane protein EccD [Actinomycetota bacterium]